MTEDVNVDLALELESRLRKENLNDGAIAILTMVLPNIVKGCPWAFVLESEAAEFTRLYGADISNSVGFNQQSTGNGVLVTVQVDRVATILNNIGLPDVFSKADYTDLVEKRNSNINSLRKYLEKQQKAEPGKAPSVLGIYNLNDYNQITLKGQTFPAFAVTYDDLGLALRMAGLPFRPLSGWAKQYGFDTDSTVLQAPSGNALLTRVGPMPVR